ncbi:MAG: MBL fold metallo-hydrolase [Euryarchaeota archaeon]|nr:MBL fold metallo-hydrolase [Euryarchaeota archaeon]
MTNLTFLGTGGGRFATIYQPRGTGGIYLSDGVRIHIDPGPGAAVNMSRLSLDPAKTRALLISHCHPDHYTDAEILIEGMARGGFGRSGLVVGSRSVVEGVGVFGPAISDYHKSIAGEVRPVSAKDTIAIEEMRVDITPTLHSDPTGVGFRFHTSNGDISYVGDSEIGSEIVRAHRGSRMVIICLTRPLGSRIAYHMCTEDAAEFVERSGPEVALLTHFGMKLLHEGPERQARYIEKKSGVRTVAATDLMTIQINKSIQVRPFESREAGQGRPARNKSRRRFQTD